MNTVTLHDGTQVPADSEAWRHECEARHIAGLPSRAARTEWLEALERRRGREAVDQLRATIKAVWPTRKAGR